jgi:hypothetical protein
MPATVIRRLPDNRRPTVETDPLELPSVGRTLRYVTNVTPSGWGGGMTPTARAWAKVAIALALMSLVACSSSNGNDAPPPSKAINKTTPAPLATPPDPQAQAKAAILAVYRAFWTAASAAEAHPHRSPANLRRYAVDKALASTYATIALYRQQGIVVRGPQAHTPEVVAIAGSGDGARATIRDCVDLSAVEAVYKSTGKSALAPNQSRRHMTTAQAIMRQDRWVIRDVAANRAQAC